MRSLKRILAVLELTVVFVFEFLKANWMVAKLVLNFSKPLQPAVFTMPLKLQSDVGIALLTQMITLTPGTLSLAVAPNKSYVLVHVIDTTNVGDAILSLQESFEQRLIRIFHG